MREDIRDLAGNLFKSADILLRNLEYSVHFVLASYLVLLPLGIWKLYDIFLYFF